MDEQIRELRAIRYGIGIATGFILLGIAMIAGDASESAALIVISFVILFVCGINRAILFFDMYHAKKREENEKKMSPSKPPRTHRSSGRD